jgi:hypothetical protein
MKLTDAQKEVLLYIGGPDDDGRPIPLEVQGELVQLGLVYKRDEGSWDLTEQGEEVYDELSERKDGW